MKIGNFETENNVFLAPMAGVTGYLSEKYAEDSAQDLCIRNGECERTVLQR